MLNSRGKTDIFERSNKNYKEGFIARNCAFLKLKPKISAADLGLEPLMSVDHECDVYARFNSVLSWQGALDRKREQLVL